jgi:DNA-binding transcriptional ArsR family regulator
MSGAEPGMLVGERRHRILDLLREHGKVTVEALASRFATSAVTIRNDLAALEAGGAIERTHGGALLPRDDEDQPLTVKRTLHHAEKVRIARSAHERLALDLHRFLIALLRAQRIGQQPPPLGLRGAIAAGEHQRLAPAALRLMRVVLRHPQPAEFYPYQRIVRLDAQGAVERR